MVGQKAIAMNNDVEKLTGLFQSFEKQIIISFFPKNLLTLVASGNNMIESIGVLNS